MAEDEGRLSFVAGMDDSDFVRGATNIRETIHETAKDVKQTGLTVAEFTGQMQKLLGSFDRMTAAVDRNTNAQEQAAKSGMRAAEAEKQGADKATRAIDETGKATDELGRKLRQTGDEGSASFDKLTKYAAGFFTIQKASELGRKIFDVRQEMEKLLVSFKTLAGTDVGQKMYEDIKDFTLHTPMMMNDLAKGAQTMLGFNIEAEKVMPILRQIGDISMGDSQKFNSLTLAFSQMSSTGKLMGQDLLQMINAGFNPLVVISEKTGKSIANLKEEMSKGLITVEMVEDAFRTATDEGGKFHGMLEQQSKTIGGAYSNLQGAISEMFNSLGEKSEGVMMGAIDTATSLAQNYEKVGRVIMGLVGTYGVYKTAVMVVTALESFRTKNLALQAVGIQGVTAAEAIHYHWLVLTQKAQELLNATMLTNQYVAVSIAATAFGIYKLATAEGVETAARRRANEEMQAFADKLDEQQNKIKGYIQTLQDETATEYQKAEAWEMLNKLAPTLTEKYDKATLSTLDLADATKELNNELDNANYEHIRSEIQKWKDTIESIKRNMNDDSRYNGGKNASFYLQQLKGAEAQLDAYLKKLAEVDRIRNKMAEDAPIEIRIKEAEGNKKTQDEIYGFYEKAMLLAQRLQNTNEAINYDSAKGEFEELISTLEKDVEELRGQVEGKPANFKLKLEYDEKRKVLEDILNMKSQWDRTGVTTIPLYFQLHFTDAEQAKNEAEKTLNYLTGQYEEKKTVTKTASQHRAEAYSAWRTAENALSDFYNSKNKIDDATFATKVKELTDNVSAAKKRYQELGGDVSKSKSKSHKNDSEKREKLRRQAQEIQEEQRYQEELSKIRRQAEDARTDATIAAIINDSERERAEQDEQHKRNLRQIEDQADEMKKAIYEHNKRVWENSHKDSPYELTEEGKAGWQAIKSLYDLRKEREEIAAETNKALGISILDPKTIAEGKKGLDDIISQLERMRGLSPTDITINEVTERSLRLHGLTDEDIRKLIDGTIAIGDVEDALRSLRENGDVNLQLEGLENADDMEAALQSILSYLSEIGKKKTVINTTLGEIEKPDIPSATQVTTEVNSEEYDKLVSELGEDAVKRIAVDVSGDSIPEAEDQVMKVVINTDTTQLDALKASLPKESPIEVYTVFDTSDIDAIAVKLKTLGVSDAFIDSFKNGEVSAERLNETISKLTESQKKLNDAQKGYDNAPNKLPEEQEAILKAQRDKLDAERKRQERERRNNERQQLLDYIKEYGSMQAQRAAIAEEYDRKIAETSDAIQKASLQRQKETALSELDMKAVRLSIDWETVFNDLDKVSTESLKELREKLRAALNTGDVDPENAKVLSEKILEVENRISERTNVLSSLIPALRERERLTRLVAQAEEDVARAQSKSIKANLDSIAAQRKAQESIKKATGRDVSLDDITSLDTEGMLKLLHLDKVGKGNEQLAETAKVVKEAMDNVATASTDAATAQEELTSAQIKARNAQNILKGIEGGFKGIMNEAVDAAGGGALGIVNVANQNIQSMKELTETLGLADTDFGAFVSDFADSSQAFVGAIQSLASGDVIGALNGIIKGFGSLGHGIGGILGLNVDYSEYDKAKEKYEQLSSVWDELIDKKKEYLSESWGTEAIGAAAEALRLLRAEEEQNRITAEKRLMAGSSAGSHSIWYRMWKGSYKSSGEDNQGFLNSGKLASTAGSINWRDVNKAVERGLSAAGLGKVSFDNMEDMLKMNANQLTWIKEQYTGLWTAMDADFRDALENIIQFGKTESEIMEQLKEQITGVSFDSVFDSFMDSLYDLADGSEDVFDDVAENWRQMMNKMVLNNLVGGKYKEELRKWYEQWSKIYDDGSIDASEIESLRDEYNEIWKSVVDEVNALREQGITTPKADANPDKDATNVIADKATYDQFEKYLGIATAQQIAQEQIKAILESWDKAGISPNVSVSPDVDIENDMPRVEIPTIQAPVVNVERDNKDAQLILSNLQVMKDIASSNGAVFMEIRNLVGISNEYLLSIRNSNSSILSTMTVKMDEMYNLMEKKL